jgi:hypothetical protein
MTTCVLYDGCPAHSTKYLQPVHSGYTHHERETLARAVEKMPSV